MGTHSIERPIVFDVVGLIAAFTLLAAAACALDGVGFDLWFPLTSLRNNEATNYSLDKRGTSINSCKLGYFFHARASRNHSHPIESFPMLWSFRMGW